jgi:hypothetical protein
VRDAQRRTAFDLHHHRVVAAPALSRSR